MKKNKHTVPSPSAEPKSAEGMPPAPPLEHDQFLFEEQRAYDDHVLREHRPKLTLDEEATYAAVFAFSGAAIGSWISRNQSTVRAFMAKLPDAAELAKLLVAAIGDVPGPGPIAAARPKKSAAKKKDRHYVPVRRRPKPKKAPFNAKSNGTRVIDPIGGAREAE